MAGFVLIAWLGSTNILLLQAAVLALASLPAEDRAWLPMKKSGRAPLFLGGFEEVRHVVAVLHGDVVVVDDEHVAVD